MTENKIFPDFIFESSWEVCNKVGGIYAVLSTRAKTLSDRLGDNLVFIGPDCWGEKQSPYFEQDNELFKDWREKMAIEGLRFKVGRWTIPGNPIAILVDFTSFYSQKDFIYGRMWEDFQVDSLHAYGDYDEASMFSFAAARIVEEYYKWYLKGTEKENVVYHANEWMTGLGALYVKKYVPDVATIFTTHATSIGRSICGNNKPLYDYLFAYNGDQMAGELNMQSKHSIEKQTAHNVDCFTTVSDITGKECEELLDRKCDVILPNGFEDNFVPKGATFTSKRNKARKTLLKIANCLTGNEFADDTVIVSTSGRYEFRNKGIDVFIASLGRLNNDERLQKKVLAFIEVPGWMAGPREDLQERMKSKKKFNSALHTPNLTHWLHEPQNDNALNAMATYGIFNRPEDKVNVIFIPSYLTGDDGIVNLSYYDVVLANDLCIYPSYYEPWGYTPLEAVAFKVPCITTDLAGFGLWVNSLLGHYAEIKEGVKVVKRTDYNFDDVVEEIENTVVEFTQLTDAEVKKARENASKISKKALWKEFIKYYEDAYDCALRAHKA